MRPFSHSNRVRAVYLTLAVLALGVAIFDTAAAKHSHAHNQRVYLEKVPISGDVKEIFKNAAQQTLQVQDKHKNGLRKAHHEREHARDADRDESGVFNAMYDLKLKSDFGMSYFGKVSVGTPAQKLTALFDTGSAFIWFTSKDCATCQKEKIKHWFDCSQSSTCKSLNHTQQLAYGRGNAVGDLMKDEFHIAGLHADKQTFIVLNQLAQMDHYPADGLIGLGFKTLSNGHTTLIENLYNQNQISNMLFALYLADPLLGESQSFLDIGTIDKSLYQGDKVHYLPAASEYYWAVELVDIFFSDRAGDRVYLRNAIPDPANFSTRAVIDSGTSIIAMPTIEIIGVIQILNVNGFQCTLSAKFGQILCTGPQRVEDYPTLNVQLGNILFVIPSFQYVMCVPRQGCIVRFTPLDLNSYVVLGDVFMQQLYTVFDEGNKRIGFALKNQYPSDRLVALEDGKQGAQDTTGAHPLSGALLSVARAAALWVGVAFCLMFV